MCVCLDLLILQSLSRPSVRGDVKFKDSLSGLIYFLKGKFHARQVFFSPKSRLIHIYSLNINALNILRLLYGHVKIYVLM